uniref:Ubiquitin-conjugating enzyme E2 R2 n=1 Tax=Salmo salar TaxID=8030 RepID=B9ELT9_SALSA|nr:Ubiquitin-conjugating enzyme E2 R2 [Salmo salar]
MPSSQKALMLELKSLQEEPVEGFRITPVEESDLYNWEVAIFGPPNTLYEGGYFKAHMKFPVDYHAGGVLHPDQSAFPRQQLGPALRRPLR